MTSNRIVTKVYNDGATAKLEREHLSGMRDNLDTMKLSPILNFKTCQHDAERMKKVQTSTADGRYYYRLVEAFCSRYMVSHVTAYILAS